MLRMQFIFVWLNFFQNIFMYLLLKPVEYHDKWHNNKPMSYYIGNPVLTGIFASVQKWCWSLQDGALLWKRGLWLPNYKLYLHTLMLNFYFGKILTCCYILECIVQHILLLYCSANMQVQECNNAIILCSGSSPWLLYSPACFLIHHPV